MHQRGLHAPLRWAYTVLGCMMVLLGIIGAFLPVMPTTVFLLMALACFSKSSPKFEQWLLQHPRFGPSLQSWRQHRVVPLKAKRAACLGMLFGLAILSLTPAPWWVVMGVGITEFMVAIYLIRRPSVIQESSSTAQPVIQPTPAHKPAKRLWKYCLSLSLLLHLGLLGYFCANWTAPHTVTARESKQFEVTMLQSAAPAVPLEEKVAPKVSQAAAKQTPKAAKPTPKAAPQPVETKITPTTSAESSLSASISSQPKTSQQSTETGPLNKSTSVAAAPAAAPASTQQASGGSNSWEGKILARLERFRRYPTTSRMRGDEGVAYLRLKMNREGQVLAAKIERSSGFPALDRAALEALERAAPLPRIPAERPDEAELLVPFEFFIK
ncbi:TonB family protein [Iodobacter sp. CM08]|uniref:TonB family protein n=1 Tax=Iodobacter sp. CM08 TaxID=3085902 RepID=UPI002981E614|nr:TonB family protein [Iodobacter sp. CM08]MDW5418350.1 TonB family protein [Iodobacter sp. CM08]